MGTTGDKERRTSKTETTQEDVVHHFTFTDLVRSQGYAAALTEATRRKAQFNDKVHLVEFRASDLVPVNNSKLDKTYETRAKLTLNWSPPQIVTDHLLNSYTLSKLDGTELNGTAHARRLRRYIPKKGGLLDQ